jgi:AcrR family transcriptional regulator
MKAMRTIQERALDLFDERGFGAVTIEEIAAAAEVSPSSVYRYYGTKEGIVVADEFDTMSRQVLEQIVDPADPVGSLIRVVRRYEGIDAPSDQSGADQQPVDPGSVRRRVRYFFAEPSIRTALCAELDRAAQRILPLLAVDRAMTPTQLRVAANALVFGYFAALEQWYLDGGSDPITAYVENGLQPLRALWSTPTGGDGRSAD